MTPFIHATRRALALAALATLAACGGGGDGSAPPQALKPGSAFTVETPLPEGGMQVALYLVHGVTRQGELVPADGPDLIPDALVPLLESETRDGKAAATARAPAALLAQQRQFYKQAWDAAAAHKGSRDPGILLEEMADMDVRIVDFMDYAAASGVTLPEYIAFFDLLDEIPELAPLTYAELNFQEALASVDAVSTFEANPPACPQGLARVVSVSGLQWFCRRPAGEKKMAYGAVQLNMEPNLRDQIIELPRSDMASKTLEIYQQQDAANEKRLHELLSAFRAGADDISSIVGALGRAKEILRKGVPWLTNQLLLNNWRDFCNGRKSCDASAAGNDGSLTLVMLQDMLDQTTNSLQLYQMEAVRLTALRGAEYTWITGQIFDSFWQQIAIIKSMANIGPQVGTIRVR